MSSAGKWTRKGLKEADAASQKAYRQFVTVDFKEYLRKWVPLSILIGVVAGLGAMLFQILLEGMIALVGGTSSWPWLLLIFIPAAGGLAAGWVAQKFEPEAVGGGTDNVIESIHMEGGRMSPKVAPVKMAASVLTIGSGGSAGTEGAVSQISGGLASLIGTRLRLKRSDMRIVVIAGMAAGLSAVFRAPLGSAIFAIEVPYKNDLESSAAIPGVIASVVSYLIFAPFGGYNPLFEGAEVPLTIDLVSMAFVIAIGLIVGVIGVAFVTLMRRVGKVFKESGLPLYATAAIGGLVVGCIGLFVPEGLGLSSASIEGLLQGSLVAMDVLLVIMVAKMLATSFTLGSGGSGGVFFPLLLIGGCAGGIMASLFGLQPFTLFVLAGMGAMMGGIMKAPIAASVLVTEMVGGFNALIPIMIASAVSYIATGNYSLYSNQIAKSSFRYDLSTLSRIKISEVMTKALIMLRADDSVSQAQELARRSPHFLYPVQGSDGSLVGVLSSQRLMEVKDGNGKVGEIATFHFETVSEGMTALEAYDLMERQQISRVMVVREDDRRRIAGLVTRLDLLNLMEHLDERHRSF
ncbi:MAG: chloride channel protein [Methanomassiliicoccales archaeon]|nr:chloride channel protein [Methanomassiliicoccales archaeon]